MRAFFYRLLCLGVVLAITAGVSWAAPGELYVLNRLGGTVSVIDPTSNKIVRTIDIPYPRGAAFSPDGTLAYISSEEEHTLDVIDRKTGTITQKVHLSGHPAGNLALTKDGRFLLIGLTPFLDLAVKHHDPKDSGGEDIIDTSTFTLVKTIHIAEGIHDTFLTPDGKYAILGADLGTFAEIIDIKTLEPVWKIPFDRAVLTIAIESGRNGSTSRLFVELKNFNGFAVVDFAKHKEVARINLPDPIKFKFGGGLRPDGSLQFNPTHGTGISPDGKMLWVTSRATNYAYVYALPRIKLITKVYMPEQDLPGQPAGGADPHWVVFARDGKTVYICLSAIDEVFALDAHTFKQVARIPVGKRPTVMEVSGS
ncbi:MAG: hypothetical protein ACRD3Q_19350 [Terriglobales bacterium]